MYALKRAVSAYKDEGNYVCNVVLTDGNSDIETTYRVHPGEDDADIHQELHDLLEAGKIKIIAAPPPPEPPVPQSCQLWQLQAELKSVGLYEAADAAIAKSANAAIQTAWAMGNSVSRNGLIVGLLLDNKVLSKSGVDKIFRAAVDLHA
jgi:hypothetical protein